jgi:hypothetical protein
MNSSSGDGGAEVSRADGGGEELPAARAQRARGAPRARNRQGRAQGGQGARQRGPGEKPQLLKLNWKQELQEGRIRVQLIYSNDNRRQAEQVEAALQEWDLTHNEPAPANGRRFSLYERWFTTYNDNRSQAEQVEAALQEWDLTHNQWHVEVHDKTVFVLRGIVKWRGPSVHVGKGGKVLI